MDSAGGLTLHIILRHSPAGSKALAFHAYLAQHFDGSHYLKSFTYFDAGLKTVQTSGRSFMEGLQKQFMRVHGGSVD